MLILITIYGIPVSKKNSIVWTNINYQNAKTNAEAMYNTENLQSILITGTQWDTTARCLQYNGFDVYDSRSWGNCKDSIGNAAINSGVKQLSGFSEYWKSYNIYDFSGNTINWTSELIDNSYSAVRSPYVGGSGIMHPAYRANRLFDNLSQNVSFRVTLLFK